MNKERELFNNNKITEALCQFTFTQHLDSDFYIKFAERIKSRYFDVQEIPLLHFNFNLLNQAPEKVELKGYRISNEKKDKIVQVFTDNLSIHQVGKYQQWESFREDIYYILAEFQKETNIQIGRIDLRTINVFEFEKEFNANEYFNVALNYPSEFIQNSNYQFNQEQIFEKGKKAGVIRGNYIKENDKWKFILDLSYINWLLDENVSSNNTEKIKASLEDGHLKLYNLFIQTVTEKTKKLITG